MALDQEALRTITKQLVGNRTSATIDDTYYNARILSGYRRLCTYQGPVRSPGMAQPQMRKLGFFELQHRQARTIDETQVGNFITPDPSSDVVTVMDIYDRTNNRGLDRRGLRELLSRDPDALGVPRVWCPAGQDGVVGYYVDRVPETSSQAIDVYEYVYKYPLPLANDIASPVIPDVWHIAIAYAAAAEAALLFDMPEKHTELEGKFMDFIAERKSPIEESDHGGLAGNRRWTPIGRR